MTIKESIVVDLQNMTATTKNGVNQKGARDVIQKHLKEITVLKGYWTVWFIEDDGKNYHFKIDNPVHKLIAKGII